ncbi:MAG TPA: urease accessory protein UreD [Stellaceae bacterium]|nr:urease accessory protein UreD [Stellaceae bacterium]
MSAATSRYEVSTALADLATTPALQRGDGAVEIAFAGRDGVTVLDHLYQRTPCRALFPRTETGEPFLATLLTTSGGLTGGDRLRIDVSAGSNAAAAVTTAAAEKLYRSLGPDTCIDIALSLEEGAWLEWLPQETILFDRARLMRRVSVKASSGGRLLAAETMVFGREARGERFSTGLLRESWRVRVGGRLVWADELRLDGDIAARLDDPMAFAGSRVMATAILVAADAADHLPAARALTEAGACRAGASVVNGVLIARFLDSRADVVRRALMRYLEGMRQAAAGLPPVLPRLWSI